MIKVKFKKSLIGLPYKKGGEYELEESEAKDFAKRGFCELLSKPKARRAVSRKRPSKRPD